MKILVTGRRGQLGSEIYKISLNCNYNWVFTDSNEFNLYNLNKVNSVLSHISPNVIINCSAFTDVENAETDYNSAYILNFQAVELIAKWSNHNNCKFIHVSTDYVYNEHSQIPITEDAPTNPINNYGKTKLLGDLACLKCNPKSIIIRTSWLYSSFGNNFVKKMICLMNKNKELNIINNQIGSPTYAADLAEVLISIIECREWSPGIYNYSNKGEISWFDLATDIKLIYGFNNITINSISSKDYPTKAKRPNYSVLDNSKIKKTFNIRQLNYKESLKKCINIIKNET